MKTPPMLLLIDDDVEIRDQMKWALGSDYELLEACDRATALAHIRRSMPPLALLDLGLPPDNDGASEGLAILREMLQLNPFTKVIVVTGNSDRTKALAAIESGAYDFIEKPVQLEVLKVVLQRATYLSKLELDNRVLQNQATENQFEGLMGSSERIQDVFRMIRRVGPTDVPVLITGESGTGKELVARAVHRQGPRKEQPFIVINCGAIPETLLESELFGYEKGSFTGAARQRKGRIEHAQGGTLFLDEIGDIPLGLQVKLLRFLQDHKIQRLGARDTISVDVRVIAATNIDLPKAIGEGRFREDLYYRLCVITIALPPLSQRGADIALLARTFMLKFAEEHKKPVKGFTPQTIEALMAHRWPGNIRELENRVKRAVLMTEGKYLTPANLGFEEPDTSVEDAATLKASRERREKDLVRLALEKSEGNVSKAALELGISRPTLYQLLERYGLKKTKPEEQKEKM